MKNSIKTLVVLAMVAFAGSVFAQVSTADGLIKTCTICPISITHNQGAALDFGTLIVTDNTVDQTVTVPADGSAPTYSAGVVQYHGSNIHSEPATDQFTINGEAGYHFDLRVPNWTSTNPEVLPGSHGTVFLTNSLPLESQRQFGSVPGSEPGTMGCVTMPLGVGGTFTIPAGAPTGDTELPYQVQVSYN